MQSSRKSRPHLCPCSKTCTPIWNGLAFDERVISGDLNEGYSGDCIGQSEPLTYVVGGQEHVNDLNHCIITPLKGVLRFQVCKEDIEGMLQMSQAVLAEIEPLECEQCGRGRRTAHFVIRDGIRLCCVCDRENKTFEEGQ